MDESFNFKYISTNGVKLHCLRVGQSDKPLIILLHGFPEYWASWKNQIQDLLDAGYQLMIPDQRGYNLSSKPWRIGSYKIDKLAKDIIGLIDYAGKEKAYVIGHDWGAAVTWFIGITYPDRIHKIITINVPHPSVMKKFLLTDKEQRKKSYYMYYFQLPIIPQLYLKRKKYKRLVATLVKTSNDGTFSDEDIARYKQAWGQKRAISCMLNWYRASFRRRVKIPDKRVTVPILIVWGINDKFLKKEMAEASLDYCDYGKLEYVNGTTHWVQHEKPGEVNQLIIDFIGNT